MTAEIVDLQRFREQKDRADKAQRRRITDRRAGDDDHNRHRDKRMDNDDGAPDSTHDSTRGGEPA